MEQQIDRMKNALTIVREAIAEGLRVDFELGVTFAPTPVILVLAERAGIALAVSQDRRLWIGPPARLSIGAIPTVYDTMVGSDLRYARQCWENRCSKIDEVRNGAAEEAD